MKTDPIIKKIDFLYENKPERRKIKVTLKNGDKVYIESCYESWEQYGSTTDNLYKTMPIAEKYNDWLHGIGSREDYEYFSKIKPKNFCK